MKKKRLPSALGAALVLLCFVLVTAHFTTGMYARFTTKSGGGDTGRTASFSVSATSAQTGPVEITPATDKAGTYSVTLSNPGEIPVRYVAEVRFDNDADAAKFGTIAPLTGQIAPGGTVSGNITFDMSGYLGGGAGTVPFTVVVTFTQID
ncbi:MAG: hypothetical protein IKH09_00820 [Clostridia bacterium]|nr:hypothetical protein [Clostridia bacterium]